VLAACLTISPNALAAVFVLARYGASFLGFSPASVELLVARIAGTRTALRQAPYRISAHAVASASTISLRRAALGFCAAAAVILAAARIFARSAKGVAEVAALERGQRTAREARRASRNMRSSPTFSAVTIPTTRPC